MVVVIVVVVYIVVVVFPLQYFVAAKYPWSILNLQIHTYLYFCCVELGIGLVIHTYNCH